jgi:hypothetical protein
MQPRTTCNRRQRYLIAARVVALLRDDLPSHPARLIVLERREVICHARRIECVERAPRRISRGAA